MYWRWCATDGCTVSWDIHPCSICLNVYPPSPLLVVWISFRPWLLVRGRSTWGVTPYVLESKRLSPSFGHGVDWRTEVDFQDVGPFTHNVKLLS